MRVYSKTGDSADRFASEDFYVKLEGEHLSDMYIGGVGRSWTDQRMWAAYGLGGDVVPTFKTRKDAELAVMRNGFERLASLTEAFNEQRNESARIIASFLEHSQHA